jgi:serine/threonine-protein kinase
VSEDRADGIEQLFRDALALDASDRPAFLDAATDDEEIRSEVRSLLAAHERAGEFLGTTASPWIGSDMAPELPPDRFGPFRLVRELGRGGMGVVWLAERADGQFQQRVALKVLKRGMDSDEILRRFLAERRILASLEHPHIARLQDGGISEHGQPYFAMEYVDGAPLLQHCDERGLGIGARLGLFSRVAEAVAYAHQKLVVHRDLKPSNILVSASGEVKLLDFGIAKLLDPAAPDDDRTATGLRMVTPAYGSPEQLRGEPVTTAADIYALGVILYELLTGSRPYRVAESTPAHMLDAMETAEPAKPSVLVSRPEAVPAPDERARVRDTTLPRLRRRLRGDLDTIVLKALHKEPGRRYPSAEALCEDIRRHLSGEPVRARPDTAAYRIGKFVRRNVAVILALGLVIASLATGLTIALWQRGVASREAARAAEVHGFLVEVFDVADPELNKGETVTARELLERAADRVERGLVAGPELQGEVRHLIGTLFHKLGLYDRAVSHLEGALALRRGHSATRPDVATTLQSLATVWLDTGDYDRAKKALEEAIAILRESVGDDHAEMASALDALGLVLAEQGQYDEAARLQRRALAIYREAGPEEARRQANVLSNLGLTLRWKGDFAEAERIHREALTVKRGLYGNDHPTVGWALEHLGVGLCQRGAYDEAEPLMREGLATLERVYGANHPDVALTTNNLAKLFLLKGEPAAAEPLLRKALAANVALYGERSRRVAVNLTNLGEVAAAMGRLEEAVGLHEKAVAVKREAVGDAHPDVAISLGYLARVYRRLGRPGDSGSLYREAIEIGRRVWSADQPLLAAILAGYGELKLDLGESAAAEPLLREALGIRERTLAAKDWQVFESKTLLGECLLAQGSAGEAEPLLRAGYDGLRGAKETPAFVLERAERSVSLLPAR